MAVNNPPVPTPAGDRPQDGASLSDNDVERAVQAARREGFGAWLAPLLAPPVVGLGLIIMVAAELGNPTLTRSPGAASAALAVGAILILGSAALYVFSPTGYDHFFTDLRKRLEAGVAGVDRQLPRAPRRDPPA